MRFADVSRALVILALHLHFSLFQQPPSLTWCARVCGFQQPSTPASSLPLSREVTPTPTNPWFSLDYVTSLVAQLVKNLPAMQETRFDPWVGRIHWRRGWRPTPVFLPGKFHEQRSLTG